jgi:VWFA-related protein
MRQWFLASLVLATAVVGLTAARQAPGSQSPAVEENTASLRITSPLGRTGTATKVRIVAQVTLPQGVTLSPLDFYVDGVKVGSVESGPPYGVDWVDENPLERREIVIQANDSAGHLLKDTVVLPAYEVVEKTGVTGVLLETSVYDKTGRFVSSLDPKELRVTENGVDQVIDSVTRETIPNDLVMLVDNSQSMSRRMDFVRRATERIAASLHKKDRAIVAPFNKHIGTITGPSDDAATLGQAIAAMHAGGGTALLDALIEAMHLLEHAEGRRAIVLLTDGYDENSVATQADVLKAIGETQVTVYVVGIGGVAGISLKGEAMMKTIAEKSGGRVYFPPREMELVQAADAISSDTHSRYLITYTPTNQEKDGTWREVAVTVPEGYHARTRAGYFAPAPPPIRPTIEFTVLDASRRYVDVTAADLEVMEDGVAQKVDTFQEAVDPVSIVVALDQSGSMKKSADLVRQTAKQFVLAVRPEDSLALILFADEPKYAHVLATNRQWSLDAIEKYNPNGGTALYDALWNSLLTLKGVPGRRAVVVMTDGRDENNPGTAPGSAHMFDEILPLSRQVGATIYTVGLGTKLDKDILEKLANETGGQSYFASDASALGDQFQAVVENLRRRYVLSYTSSNTEHNGKWRAVQIRPRSQGLVVATGGGYFAPAE